MKKGGFYQIKDIDLKLHELVTRIIFINSIWSKVIIDKYGQGRFFLNNEIDGHLVDV